MANILDSAIALFSPNLALKREVARRKLEQVRKYDGASQGNRIDGWHTSMFSGSANSEVALSAELLRQRSRDLHRNNPWAKKATQVICSNVVGYGIVHAIKDKAKKRNARINDLWKSWVDSMAIDHDERNHYVGLQHLVLRSLIESGEVFIRKRALSPEDMQRKGLPVPLQLQILEADYLDSNKSGWSDIEGNYILNGIEFNSKAERVFYWLYPSHPGEMIVPTPMSLSLSGRVPANEILHVYKQDRPGQVRGVPWCHAVMIALRDAQQYSDAELLKQRIAACSVAFITDPELPDYATTPSDLEIAEKLEPGAIEILPPGKDVKFATPPQNPGYEPHMRAKLHEIASGYGISFESLTGDFSQVNFSSARMGWIEMGRNIQDWQFNILIPQFLAGVWAWFQEFSLFVGVDCRTATCEYTCPRREAVDPNRDGLAVVRDLRAGLISLSEAQRERGYDPEVLLAEIKADKAAYSSIPLDSIPSEPTPTALPTQTTA